MIKYFAKYTKTQSENGTLTPTSWVKVAYSLLHAAHAQVVGQASVSSVAGSTSDFSASGSSTSSSSAAGFASGSSAPSASASGSYASGSFAFLHPKQLVLGTSKRSRSPLTLTKYLM